MEMIIVCVIVILLTYRKNEILLTSKVVSKGKIDFSKTKCYSSNKYLSYIKKIIPSKSDCYPALIIKLEDNRIFVYPDPIMPTQILQGHSVLLDETESYFVCFSKKLLLSKKYTFTINKNKYDFELVQPSTGII